MIILDCTLRDGGYINNWQWTREQSKAICRAASSLPNVEVVEVGFRRTPNPDDQVNGPLYYSTEETLRHYVPRDMYADVAVMAQVGTVTLEDFCPAKDSCVDIVRVLLPYHASKDAPDELDEVAFAEAMSLVYGLHAKGYRVMFNIGRADKVTSAQWGHIVRRLYAAPIEVIYLADTYGAVADFSELVRASGLRASGLSWAVTGAHAHDNLGDATARTKNASACFWGDGTLLGLGRGAGNARTELLVNCLTREVVAACIDHLPDGYRILYVLTGALSAHVNYANYCRDNGVPAIACWAALHTLHQQGMHHYYDKERMLAALADGSACPDKIDLRP